MYELARVTDFERSVAWLVRFWLAAAIFALSGSGCLLAPAEVDEAAQLASPFASNSDGTMSDTRTGLIWQRNASADKYTWEEAQAHCASLSLAGRAWRLPSKGELETLVDDTRTGPASHPDVPRTQSDSYWTATALVSSELAWKVSFRDGASHTERGSAYARCVDSGTALPNAASPGRYAIGDGHILLDKATNRSWQRVDGSVRNHEDALQYCDDLELSGGGWRLPRRWELLTLVDPAHKNPATDTDLFPDAPAEVFWTATVYQRIAGRFWTVHFATGTSQEAASGVESYRVRCVR